MHNEFAICTDLSVTCDKCLHNVALAAIGYITDCVASATLVTLFLLLQTLTVPYLIDNPEVGYVQTRWVFANPDESYLTKVHFLPCFSTFALTLQLHALIDSVKASGHVTASCGVVLMSVPAADRQDQLPSYLR